MARARLTIDLAAIAANWRALAARSGPATETAAVVKAGAYGLGLAPVARALAAAGARTFFVALAEEGAELRAALGPGPEILVLDGLMPQDAALFAARDLVAVLNSPEQVARHVAELPGRAAALQVETGMNRLGIPEAELGRLGALPPVALVMSHLAAADAPDDPANAAQAARFAALRARFPGVRASLAATGGILLGRAFHHDLVRPGIGIFGGAPFAEARPVVALTLPVLQVREVAAGERVGYGGAWTARRPSRIATLAAGYADGLHRCLGAGGARAWAGERPCPFVGRVSMDLITVDVTGIADLPAALEILGPQQGIDALAAAAGTIGYEILTGLGARYERVYTGAPDPGGRPDAAPEPGPR